MVRVFMDYDPIKLFVNVSGDVNENAHKAGLVGNYVDVPESDFPKDRKYRNYWKVENGKVVEDSARVQQHEALHTAKRNKIDSALARLGISKEDFKLLMGA